MKKNILLIIPVLLILLTACSLSNNPNSKVEEYLSKYQKFDKSLNLTYYDLIKDETISNSQKEEINKLIKKQAKSLVYDIKDTKIDGYKAIVTVEIEVNDYKNVFKKYKKNNYNNNEYYNNIIDKLNNTKEKITYTIDFKVTKNNKNWKLDELDSTQKEKLLGIY